MLFNTVSVPSILIREVILVSKIK